MLKILYNILFRTCMGNKTKNVRIAKSTSRYVPNNITSQVLVYVRKSIHVVLAARHGQTHGNMLYAACTEISS